MSLLNSSGLLTKTMYWLMLIPIQDGFVTYEDYESFMLAFQAEEALIAVRVFREDRIQYKESPQLTIELLTQFRELFEDRKFKADGVKFALNI